MAVYVQVVDTLDNFISGSSLYSHTHPPFALKQKKEEEAEKTHLRKIGVKTFFFSFQFYR